MTFRTLLILLALRTLAQGHSAPIDPSLCTFDPFEIIATSAGVRLDGASATDADRFRIVYDPAPSLAQFCAADPASPTTLCTTSQPRALSGNGLSGTALLSAFQARISESGDIAVSGAPFTLMVGSATVSAALSLTTGLADTSDSVVEGAPLSADGSFTLVGGLTLNGLGAPLDNTNLALRMRCQATPPPDLDQFTPPPQTTAFAAKLTPSAAQVRVAFRPGATTPDFRTPALVRLSSAEQTIATLVLPAGLTAAGRKKFTGQAENGTITVRSIRRGASYNLILRLSAVVLPPGSAKRATVQLTYQVGGFLGRATRTLRIKGGK